MTTFAYRFFLYRRLSLLCAGILALSVLICGGGAQTAGLTLLIAVIFFGSVLAWFPDSWLETSALALTMALIVPIPLYWDWFLAAGGSDGMAFLGLGVAFGGLFVMLGFVMLLVLFDRFLVPSFRYGHKATLPLPLEEGAEALLLWPGKETKLHRCGALTEEGLFPVSLRLLTFKENTLSAEEVDVSFWIRPMKDTRSAEEIEIVSQELFEIPQPGGTFRPAQAVSRARLVRLNDESCRFETETLTDGFSILAAAFHWLRDYSRDHTRNQVDAYLGRPSPSTARGTGRSWLALLARFFIWSGLAPKPDEERPPF